MKTCVKCSKDIPDDALYCPSCGASQQPQKKSRKKRGNGEGTVYRLPDGSYKAVKTVGYQLDNESHKAIRKRVTKSGFKTKKEALAYLPQLGAQPQGIRKDETFLVIYEMWLPIHMDKGVTKSTMDYYKAAFQHYKPIWYTPFSGLTIEALQACLDNCPHGKRTRQNMKALGTLLYKYAIPRGYVDKNLAQYLTVKGEASKEREPFTDEEIEIVRQSIGKVPYADYIYCQIYTGFRVDEFLKLDIAKYNREKGVLQGGEKTEAGTDRYVSISPKIQPIIDRLTEGRTEGLIFTDENGKALTPDRYRKNCFYPALKAMELPLPAPDGHERKLTPHCCRHTFATLVKRIDAPTRDKLELIGHTDEKMLQHYQHANYEDLKAITDKI